MGSPSDLDLERIQEAPLRVKGGLRTIPFVIANEVLEKVASSGLQANMIIYLTQEYHMSSVTAASVLFAWGAVANVLPMFGAFLSDSYVGRFRMIAFASFSCLMGITLMWLTALLPGAKPPACSQAVGETCRPASPQQLCMLFLAFVLIGVGSAGIRPCSIAFGADQLAGANTPNREKTLQAYFNWYYASVGISFMLSSTVIVYMQDKRGWKIGFGVPAALMLLAAALFLVGSPLYIKVKSHGSTQTGFLQVVVAAVRNRHLKLAAENLIVQYHHGKSSDLKLLSDKLRFFNKACFITDAADELNLHGQALNPWRLCTVEQVEDLKSVIRVFPLWSTGIMVSLVMSQSFPVLQARTMDRHIGRSFQIPAGSFSVFQLITLTLWSGAYDRFIFPVLVKLSGRPDGLTLKQRMGIGILISAAATGVATVVEAARRRQAGGMTAMWLVPQYGLVGLAEAFNVIGQVEFYYSVLPRSMNSFAVALWTLGYGAANLVGTLIVKVIAAVTGRGGRVSWLASDLNKGHYDYYYLVLTILGVANFFYFLVCSWAYGEEVKKKPWEREGEGEEQLHS